MIGSDSVDRLPGTAAVDPQHRPLGRVHEVFVDEFVAVPTWVSIQLVHDGEVLVPLDGAALDDRCLHIAVTRDQIDEVPEAAAEEPLSAERERLLYERYGLSVSYSVHDDEGGEFTFEAVEVDPELDALHPAAR